MRTIGIAVLAVLAGCMDQDPFGVTTRRIAGPYELKRWDEGPVQYFVQGGSRARFSDWAIDGAVLRIAWDEQHILVQREASAGRDTAWVVVDVVGRSVSGPLSESDARARSGLEPARAMPADSAWARL